MKLQLEVKQQQPEKHPELKKEPLAIDYKMVNYPFIKKLRAPTKIIFKIQKYNRDSLTIHSSDRKHDKAGFRWDRYQNLKYHSQQIFQCEKVVNVNNIVEEIKEIVPAVSEDKEIPKVNQPQLFRVTNQVKVPGKED